MLTIKQSDKSFYIGDSEKEPLAEIVFAYEGEDVIEIQHTNVSETLKGQSVGKKLVQRVAEFAREKKKKVVPLCPFAYKEMMKNKRVRILLTGTPRVMAKSSPVEMMFKA